MSNEDVGTRPVQALTSSDILYKFKNSEKYFGGGADPALLNLNQFYKMIISFKKTYDSNIKLSQAETPGFN